MRKAMKSLLLVFATVLLSCAGQKNEYDASGTFEAVETIISAEASGIINELSVEEGQQLKAGQVVGFIDTTQLSLKKDQLLAQTRATLSRKPDRQSQLNVFKEEMKQALLEQQRMQNLVQADAATRKQLDDANARVAVLEKQTQAREKELSINATGLDEETQTIHVQIRQLNDQLQKSRIVNKIDGVVLTKFAEKGEMAVVGKPLYKIADLTYLTLRAYITGSQLPGVKLNDSVAVFIDDTSDSYKRYTGVIQWISDKAEFTPKTIQTKDERANLVYAVKVRVKNDGYLKIGMYGELKL